MALAVAAYQLAGSSFLTRPPADERAISIAESFRECDKVTGRFPRAKLRNKGLDAFFARRTSSFDPESKKDAIPSTAGRTGSRQGLTEK